MHTTTQPQTTSKDNERDAAIQIFDAEKFDRRSTLQAEVLAGVLREQNVSGELQTAFVLRELAWMVAGLLSKDPTERAEAEKFAYEMAKVGAQWVPKRGMRSSWWRALELSDDGALRQLGKRHGKG